jgi:Lon protease-like protein
MAASFVLPLYPLEGQVLLPGEDLLVPVSAAASAAALDHARGFGGALIASLADGDSVHEIAVTAIVSRSEEGEVSLRGVDRCRLVALIDDSVPLARAERVPDPQAEPDRSERLARLLLARYTRLCRTLGRPFAAPAGPQVLTPLTWRVTADIGLSAEQQQGFLNVPDAVTRGKLLLVAVRDLERRERFLRPWAHLRSGSPWN